jgi:hypothetical protein
MASPAQLKSARLQNDPVRRPKLTDAVLHDYS